MQTPFANEKEFLSKTFSNISAINQEICNVEFEGCHFQDCNFTESIFKKCRFIECTFTRCNLSVIKVPQSQFTDVVFDECKLVGVDWTRASWPRLVFSVSLKFNKCIINDSSFFGLSLDEITLKNAKRRMLISETVVSAEQILHTRISPIVYLVKRIFLALIFQKQLITILTFLTTKSAKRSSAVMRLSGC
jgi:hypothetical protein